MNRRMQSWLWVLLVVGLVGGSLLSTSVPSVWAGSATWSATLSGTSPTYHRINPNSCAVLASGVGTDVFYQAQSFTVDITGTYLLTNDTNSFTQTGDFAGDSFLVLYQGSFDPASATTNCVAVDDEGAGNHRAQIATTLTAGVTYIVVTSPFDNGSTGSFSNSISGPGNISGPGLTVSDNTLTPTITSTLTPTNSATVTATPTASSTATATPTVTNTATDTPTQTATSTVTPTNTANRLTVIVQITETAGARTPATQTPTPSPTASATGTPTPTLTPTPTGSITATATMSLTPTRTQTRTVGPPPGNRLTVFAIGTKEAQ